MKNGMSPSGTNPFLSSSEPARRYAGSRASNGGTPTARVLTPNSVPRAAAPVNEILDLSVNESAILNAHSAATRRREEQVALTPTNHRTSALQPTTAQSGGPWIDQSAVLLKCKRVIEQLHAELEAEKDRSAQLERDSQPLQTEVGTLRADLEGERRRRREAQAEGLQLESRLNEAEARALGLERLKVTLETQVDLARDELAQTRDALTDSQFRAQELEVALRGLDARASSGEQRSLDAASELGECRSTLMRCEEDRTRWRGQAEAREREGARLAGEHAAELTRLQRSLEEAKREGVLRRGEAESDALRRAFASEQEAAALKGRLEARSRDVEEREAALHARHQDVLSLNVRVDALNAELAQTRRDLGQRDREVAHQAALIETHSARAREAEEQRGAASERCVAQAGELHALGQRLAELSLAQTTTEGQATRSQHAAAAERAERTRLAELNHALERETQSLRSRLADALETLRERTLALEAASGAQRRLRTSAEERTLRAAQLAEEVRRLEALTASLQDSALCRTGDLEQSMGQFAVELKRKDAEFLSIQASLGGAREELLKLRQDRASREAVASAERAELVRTHEAQLRAARAEADEASAAKTEHQRAKFEAKIQKLNRQLCEREAYEMRLRAMLEVEVASLNRDSQLLLPPSPPRRARPASRVARLVDSSGLLDDGEREAAWKGFFEEQFSAISQKIAKSVTPRDRKA